MTSSTSKADAQFQNELAETPVDRLLVSEARLLADAYKQECLRYAKVRLQSILQEQFDFFERERQQREAYIQARKQELDSSPSKSTQNPHHHVGATTTASVHSNEIDFSLSRLNSIRQDTAGAARRVRIPRVSQLPKYDAWVPVIQNHFVDDTDVEPYHPYFGESERSKDLAKEVYEQMIFDKDIGPFDEHSDGEEIRAGRPVPPEALGEIEIFYGLQSIRTRAARRHSILELSRRHGKIDPVWKALSVAFNIADMRRLRYIYDLSERRENETQKRITRLEKSRSQAKVIQRAIGSVEVEQSPILEDINCSMNGALKYFCHACHQFACHLHEGENVVPVLPIPDHAAETRMIELSHGGKRPAPCSQSCFLLDSAEQDPIGIREWQPWSPEQVQILRQAVLMFEWDSCSLSIMVPEKTCREVHARLQMREEATLIRNALRLTKMPRRPGVNGSESEDDEPLVRRKRHGRPRRNKNVSAKKSAPQASECGVLHENHVRKRFRPCDHAGGCFKKNSCICALNEVNCEAQCGCSCGRFVQGVSGMRWEAPSELELRTGLASKCKLRSWGCKCRTGHCNTAQCECYADVKACDPDFCTCDCCILPAQIGIRRRRCRSANTITSTHKRTLIGRSKVHGYGLFAGDFFAVGDLVGQYCGRIMDPELADKSLRASQAKKQTYAFELTDDLTVDAGCVGSKVKFINHSADSAKINCGARIERVRGDGRIALRTTKPVYPGDEFLFNYNIVGDGGNDWMIHEHELPQEGDTDSGSGSSPENSIDRVGQRDNRADPQILVSGVKVEAGVLDNHEDPQMLVSDVKLEDQEISF